MKPKKTATTSKKPLTSVMEDYLEAIVELEEEKRVVRVKDIAKKLSVKMPSVTSMLKNLNEKGLVNYRQYEYVELTKKGAEVGKEMRKRHEALRKFLTDILRVDFETANSEACKMEHALSSGTLKSLTDFMDFIQACPRAGEGWLDQFAQYRQHGKRPEKCAELSEEFSCELKSKIEQLKGCDGCGRD